VTEAGFASAHLRAIEGPYWLLENLTVFWEYPELRERLLTVLRRVEAESSLIGASSHIMAIASRPPD
jgi:hypothetical protein